MVLRIYNLSFSCQQDRKKYSLRFNFFNSTVSIFHISNIDLHVVDIPEILQNNHVTTVMREATAKKDFQEHLVVKTKYYNILTITANSLLHPPWD